MGEHGVGGATSAEEIRAFTRALLSDIEALEALLARGGIERGVRRVGLEQEMFLVDARGRPACVGPEVLAAAGDSRLTTELARFNLEANLEPQLLTGSVLTHLEEELNDVVRKVNAAAEPHAASVLLTGILPCLQHSDLTLEQMTPEPRYEKLNRAIMEMRGGPFSFHLRGADELNITHDCVMLESANTSFQAHYQVSAEEFGDAYNVAQLITAPLLAASVGSPLLLGKRLWQETRVAVFERAVDVRSASQAARGLRGRVSFGDAWVRDGALELFREDAARYRVLLTREAEADPLALVREGKAPQLRALCLHNGTVWRWNRACYGSDGTTAHLRIENRVLPSGPTVIDELANAALFWGAMLGFAGEAASVPSRLDFDAVRADFVAAARLGLDAQLCWLDERRLSARDLLLQEVIPAARRGLRDAAIAEQDADRLLGVVEARVRSGVTAAVWMLRSFDALRERMTAPGAACALAQSMLELSRDGQPVHTWPLLGAGTPSAVATDRARTLREIMTTDLFTVRPEDILDLATSVMRWRKVRHVPVEDEHGGIVGLLTARSLFDAMRRARSEADAVSARDVCDKNPLTLSQDTTVDDAVRSVLAADVSCALVVDSKDRLVGLVTERDLLRALAPSG